MNEQQQNPHHQTSTHEQISINQINMKHNVQCRICLQNADDSALPLISPCKCIGSVKYVHQECLEQWIAKIVCSCKKKIGNGKAHILCQLCQTTINFETEKHLKCKSGEEIVEKIKSAKRNLILLILLMLVNLGFCLALLDYLIRFGFSNLMEKSVILVSLIISGQVILGLVAIISGCFVVKNYLLKSEIKIFRIKTLSFYKPHRSLPSPAEVNNNE